MGYEISTKLDQLFNAWQEFKSINDKRLTEIEKKNFADPLLNEQLNRLNFAINQFKDKIEYVETKS